MRRPVWESDGFCGMKTTSVVEKTVAVRKTPEEFECRSIKNIEGACRATEWSMIDSCGYMQCHVDALSPGWWLYATPFFQASSDIIF